MKWKERLYETYNRYYRLRARGALSRSKLETQFPAWDTLYGGYIRGGKDVRILDLGCGNGELVFWLKQRGYKNVSGVDANIELINDGKDIGISDLYIADARSFLESKTDVFDYIIARDFIEHFSKEELVPLLEALYASLRSGGVCIIQTPNAESPFGARYRYQDFTHEIGFTRTSLYHVLRTAGFEHATCFPLRPVVHGVVSGIRLILWYGIELLLRLYNLIELGSGEGIFTQNMIAITKKI